MAVLAIILECADVRNFLTLLKFSHLFFYFAHERFFSHLFTDGFFFFFFFFFSFLFLFSFSQIDPEFLPVLLWSGVIFLLTNFFSLYTLPRVLPLYNKLSPRDQGEWVTRVSSTINAFVTGFLCLYALCTDDVLWLDGVYYRARPTMYAIAIAAAYFFVDFGFIMYYRIPPLPPIVAHHVLAGWGFVGGLGPIGRFPLFGSLLLLTEFTTPFNNFDWFLDKANMRDTFLYRLNFHVFTALWITFRLANWWVIGYQFFFVHWDGFLGSNGYMQFVLCINFVFLFLLNHVYFVVSGPFLAYYGLRSTPEIKELHISASSPVTRSKTRVKQA
jgi:hypothetical protein